ncbi:hypothetical protein SEVIR_1G112100v4 [Setaria viridis]|uniref:Uncharacterized protein n=2 Tax=Setaria TaxID=4554 RepID=A0A368PJ44_SETIT|nr:hypothetical protein SETIT_1G112400v2 [Setaria italica]TKW38401.1 hypothetical protein SEVIR_1G112100v2 [Setaria viridis]
MLVSLFHLQYLTSISVVLFWHGKYKIVQISEVVNHMKDLIEFSHKNNLGPKESLNSYSKTIAKFQNMHDSRQLMAAASLANNQSNTKVMGVQQEASALSSNKIYMGQAMRSKCQTVQVSRKSWE